MIEAGNRLSGRQFDTNSAKTKVVLTNIPNKDVSANPDQRRCQAVAQAPILIVGVLWLERKLCERRLIICGIKSKCKTEVVASVKPKSDIKQKSPSIYCIHALQSKHMKMGFWTVDKIAHKKRVWTNVWIGRMTTTRNPRKTQLSMNT